jgi:hypothetical protein
MASRQKNRRSYRLVNKSKRQHNRRCQWPGCTDYCWPNWFMCEKHHHRASSKYARTLDVVGLAQNGGVKKPLD